jgi:hypothetical protein
MSTNTEAEIEQMTEPPNILLRNFTGQQGLDSLSTALDDASRSCNVAILASLAQRSHALACLACFPYGRGMLCSQPISLTADATRQASPRPPRTYPILHNQYLARTGLGNVLRHHTLV